ncbi:hypothetical protein HPB48_015396 [Haemaphysalis longicornis]|uniref:Uncharacterized protein n=1 Tax=Haemaphysalis longicornis TaxID=44386 RepID=A0A9J6H5F2_HAELO|nr:hypothetical protein HPB48_015396 [Haemaphysalis longicornis]
MLKTWETAPCACLLLCDPLADAVYHVLTISTRQECLRHAQLISTSLNDSVDPCEDFNAFVCSRLKPPCQCCEDSSYGSALATRALHGWFSDFREFLDAGKDHLRAGAKALAMFDACMAPTDKEDAEAGKLMLRDVMTKLRIPWPDEPEPGVDPLGVLVMLTYRRDVSNSSVVNLAFADGNSVFSTIPSPDLHL